MVTDILTVVLTGNDLDQDRLYPMGSGAVIHDPCSRLPFQGEVTDLLAELVVVFPCRRVTLALGKPPWCDNTWARVACPLPCLANSGM